MKKLVALTSTLGLAMSLVLPTVGFAGNEKLNDTVENWDTERYGDVKDITSELNKLSEDEDFKKEALETIKESAEGINFDVKKVEQARQQILPSLTMEYKALS